MVTDLSWIQEMGMNVLLAIVILVVGWWISKVAGRSVRKVAQRSTHIDITIVPIAQTVVEWAIRIVVVVAVLARFGVQTASIIAVLGAAGLAIGLALQQTLQNIASGIMLLVLRPIRAGEFVSIVGKGDGTVDEVGLFVTRLVQIDGINVYLPNSLIWGSQIINYSRNATRRMDIAVGVRYGDDIDKAIEVLSGLVGSHEKVLQDPAPSVFVSGYKESTVNVTMRLWANVEDYWGLQFELNRTVLKTLEQAGLHHPIPVQVLIESDKETVKVA